MDYLPKVFIKKVYSRVKPHLEWAAWISGLVLLALMDPEVNKSTLCFFEWIGFTWCPGHGLGHSIAFLFRGEWYESFQAHPVGPAAVPILLFRAGRSGYRAFTLSNFKDR